MLIRKKLQWYSFTENQIISLLSICHQESGSDSIIPSCHRIVGSAALHGNLLFPKANQHIKPAWGFPYSVAADAQQIGLCPAAGRKGGHGQPARISDFFILAPAKGK